MLAGGVALNCVGNGRLLREGPFKDIWIQPAAGDAGGALGAALAVWHSWFDGPRTVTPGKDAQKGSYLGPSFSDDEIRATIDRYGAVATRLSTDAMIERTAAAIADGAVVGWFQGRMEFGPRALGARSILGDARSTTMQSTMNLKIKFRESFRPFAPSVLRERLPDYFMMDVDSPYMLLVAPVVRSLRIPMTAEQEQLFGIEKLNIPRSSIPGVTHIDYSARIQTVGPDHHPVYYRLLKAFERLTGCGVIINTSFNVRGEPIVCTPEDAYRCFMRTEMDLLVLGDYVLAKKDQKPLTNDTDWRKEFALD